MYSVSITTPPNLIFIRHTIQHLHILNTQIEKLPHLYFKDSSKINTIDLSCNHIQSFPDLCHIAATVKGITISDNKITVLNLLCNSTFPQLRFIQANRNIITAVDWNMLRQMPNLRNLHLSENRLHNLPDITKIDMSDHQALKFVKVLLSKNPWVCDHTLAWVLQGKPGRGAAKANMQFINSPIVLRSSDGMCCAYPAKWKGTALFLLGKFYSYSCNHSVAERNATCVSLLYGIMMCANIRVHYGLMFVIVFVYITLPHCHHYAEGSKCTKLLKRLWGIFCRVCVYFLNYLSCNI